MVEHVYHTQLLIHRVLLDKLILLVVNVINEIFFYKKRMIAFCFFIGPPSYTGLRCEQGMFLIRRKSIENFCL
jgi:hypothetical protein